MFVLDSGGGRFGDCHYIKVSLIWSQNDEHTTGLVCGIAFGVGWLVSSINRRQSQAAVSIISLANTANLANASESRTANSARIFRSTDMLAFFRPDTNWL